MPTLIRERGERQYVDNWGSLFLHSYIRLNPGTDAAAFGEKIRLTIRDAFGEAAEEYNIEMVPYLQPVADLHLHSNLMAELEPNSNISYIYIFSAVAVFILVIACINFMNLSTARSTRRRREVGMRKVSGATREQLIRQFLGESLILSFMGMILAFALVEAMMPFFSNLTGIGLEPFLHRPLTILVAVGLAIVMAQVRHRDLILPTGTIRPAISQLKMWRMSPLLQDGHLRYTSKEIPLTGECMHPKPLTIRPEALATAALQVMEERKVTSLRVTSEDGFLEGLIHIHDLWQTQMF